MPEGSGVLWAQICPKCALTWLCSSNMESQETLRDRGWDINDFPGLQARHSCPVNKIPRLSVYHFHFIPLHFGRIPSPRPLRCHLKTHAFGRYYYILSSFFTSCLSIHPITFVLVNVNLLKFKMTENKSWILILNICNSKILLSLSPNDTRIPHTFHEKPLKWLTVK